MFNRVTSTIEMLTYSVSISVDGLAKCNEQVRSTVEEHINASHLSGGQPSNISGEHAHVSANFPFLEGSPFTATLWAGVEGFHMTVNGRHETSFAYREVRYNITCDCSLQLWLGETMIVWVKLIRANNS